MAKKTNTKSKSILQQSRERRDAILKKGAPKPEPLNEQQRETVLTMLREGATLAEICTMRELASYSALYLTRNAAPEFDAAVRGAMAQGAEAAIAEAAELSKQAAKTDDPDLVRIAEAFHRTAVSYAEKMAPREFGQLVKLGNIDGGALQLHVVSYATPAKALQAQDAPALPAGGSIQRPAIEAQFDDLDPA